jgi:hypothetical protein
MKKGCLFIIMLLLAACGGGGGGAAVSGGGGQQVATATGAVSLQFVAGVKQASAKTVASLTTVSAGRVRIVISNSDFKKIVDLPFGSPDTTVTLPVGAAYTAEAVYYELGSPNKLTEHGVSALFNVASDTTNAASVTMTPITAVIAPPVSVYSGSTYGVTASTPADLAAVGLQKEWSLAVGTTLGPISATVLDPFTGSVHLAQTPSELHTNVAAPITDKPGRLYFQGEFFIKAALLDVGESANNWSFTVEPALNASTELKVTTIAGPINLPADTSAPQITSFSVPTVKQGTTTIAPISIKGIDNAGIAGYMITTTAGAPDGTVTTGWSAAMPTSYLYTGALPNGSGADNSVTLYAWVKDFSGNVSGAGASATKTVIINDSPVVKSFAVPTVTQFGTTISPITFTGKNNTGADNLLYYLITESAVKPLASAFPAQAGAPTSYAVSSITQVSGTNYSVPLYAWVMDVNGSISLSLRNTVTVNDVPQVTAFTASASVANGNVADILSFTGSAASGSIAKYLITTTSAKPVAADFTLTSRPLTFSYPYAATSTGLTIGTAATKTLYAWVLDDATPGRISLAKAVNVRFLAP